MAQKALIRVLRENLRRSLRGGDLAQAEALLEQLENDDPLSVETRGFELEVLLAAGREREAEVLLGQLLRLFPSSARIHFLAGRLFYRRKDYARALESFAEAERLHPHWTAQLWLGKAHTQRGDYAAAESLLLELMRDHPEVGRDLAWLYERRGEPGRALAKLEQYLKLRPEDRFAQAQQLRLRASAASPEELVEEVEELQGLGEAVAPEMLPTYVQRLLETGRGAEARRFIEENAAQWPAGIAGRIAWSCHRLQAYDLALRLFLADLPVHVHEYKYLSALESAARHCERVGDVIAAYRPLADQHRHLYGRIRALARHGGGRRS